MTETNEVKTRQEVKEPQEQGSFKWKLENSTLFKTIISTLASIIDETTFTITPEEFQVSAMDPSKICILKLTIEKEDFDEYECSTETKVSLNLDDLEKIINRSTAADYIELSYKKDSNKVKITMQQVGETKIRNFSLGIIDLDTEKTPIKNLLSIEYPAEWTIDPDFLEEAIKDAEIYSDILVIKAKHEEGLELSAYGPIGEMIYALGKEDLIEINVPEDSIGSYSIRFLKSILKLGKVTEKLEVSLKEDHPIRLHFDLLEGAKVQYYLAPRVDQEKDSEEGEMEGF